MNHQKVILQKHKQIFILIIQALAALRLKSEFEQFSGARKQHSGQQQHSQEAAPWQSFIPGSQVATGFPVRPSKSQSEQPNNPRTSHTASEMSKDEVKEENKIAKAKKEPGIFRFQFRSEHSKFNDKDKL